MRRRDFISLFGCAAAWPIAARAQQPLPLFVGWLYGGAQYPPAATLSAFHKGINEVGYFEGRNFGIVFRGTEQLDHLRALASELAAIPVSAILSTGTVNATRAAKAATTTIPIVFTTGGDPVALKLVTSMNRPGANVTGVSFLAGSLLSKRLELLSELIPKARTIAFLTRPTNDRSELDTMEMQTASQKLGLKSVVFYSNTAPEIDAAIAAAVEQKADALLVAPDTFFLSRREQLVALTAAYRIPASYGGADYVRAGGLMSYSDDRNDTYRQAGRYIGFVLRGEKPSALPVLQPTKFEFAINPKTAKTLGLTFPQSFYLRADEVIE
jgi:putative ABC transport system substrate-binding protein